ncbi:MAG TPA: hypothetical protein PKE59_00150 [Novosphingobium sp.]|jgi:hypothetical protein|nr:hypothetical protein [Novosphingobium sp.]
MNRYLMLEHPETGTEIHAYTEDEVVEIFGELGSAKLAEGEVIFGREGGLWADMGAAAKDKIEAELLG